MFYLYNGRVYKKVGVLLSGKFIMQCLGLPDVTIVVDPAKLKPVVFNHVPAGGHLMFR